MPPSRGSSVQIRQHVRGATGLEDRSPLQVEQPLQVHCEARTVEWTVLAETLDALALRIDDPPFDRVELGSIYESVGRVNGQPATLVGIFLPPGANALDVAERVKDTVNELAQRFPQGLAHSTPSATSSRRRWLAPTHSPRSARQWPCAHWAAAGDRRAHRTPRPPRPRNEPGSDAYLPPISSGGGCSRCRAMFRSKRSRV
ncbi:MAG: efflux RND transporter permease subunit, partial [Burkholderiales bacterium]